MEPEEHDRWYAVRSLFRLPDDVESAYEERITIWRARSVEEAMDRAQAEAQEYAEFAGATYLPDVGQAYHLADAPPRDGAEVFSLMRSSRQEPDAYLDTFFDTGTERAQVTEDA